MPVDHGLVTPAELAAMLDRPELRLFDCTTYLEPAPPAAMNPTMRFPDATASRPGIFRARIFSICKASFSDRQTKLHFMMPDVAQLEAAFGRHGVSAGSKVVLYSIGTPMWATRFAWMLQSLGFDNAAVLDGGLGRLEGGGRAVETGPAKAYPPATFTAKPRGGYFVGKRDVLAAKDERNTVVINALGPQFHKGLEPSVTAGRDACREAATCRRPHCSIRRPRRSCRSTTPRRNSQPKASPKTSA